MVNFVKEVPDFKQLDEQDQVIIIRNAAVEVRKFRQNHKSKLFPGPFAQHLRFLQLRKRPDRNRPVFVSRSQAHRSRSGFIVSRKIPKIRQINLFPPTSRGRKGLGKSLSKKCLIYNPSFRP